MSSAVYIFLKEYGFSDEEILGIEDANDFIHNATTVRLKYIIELLTEIGLTEEEVHDLFLDNPWLVSESPARIMRIENILNDLEFKNEEKNKLMKNYNRAYNIDPYELNQFVKYLKNNNNSNEDIKSFLLDNSSFMGMEFEDAKKLIKK